MNLTTDVRRFSKAYKTLLRKMWEAQVIAFERGGQGWMMWTWKAEQADEWSYQVRPGPLPVIYSLRGCETDE